MAMNRISSSHVILSGCSGGGKSTLLEELSSRGFLTVPEAGRRIVEEETRIGGEALPWVDFAAFARRAIEMARLDRQIVGSADWVFFDRSLVDASAALQHATGEPALSVVRHNERYHQQVFLTPPWPEIYVQDDGRRHGLSEAIAEYDRLLDAYGGLGYETIILPRIGIHERADFILRHLP